LPRQVDKFDLASNPSGITMRNFTGTGLVNHSGRTISLGSRDHTAWEVAELRYAGKIRPLFLWSRFLLCIY
jgi:hypothetical protein